MKLKGKISQKFCISGKLNTKSSLLNGKIDISKSGATFYDDLLEKPMINGIEISGDKKGVDYGLIDEINEITNSDIEAMFNETFRMMKEV